MGQKLVKDIFLIAIKYCTWIIGLVYLIEIILSCFGIQSVILILLCGSSIIPFITIILFSFQLGYCFWHRFPIYIVITNDFINAIDFYIGVPLSLKYILIVYLISDLLIALIGAFIKNKKNVIKRNTKESSIRYNRQIR